MKTKEEVIKEAWGEYWDIAKPHMNENGFVYGGFENDYPEVKLDWDGYEEIRPISLKGIETNNGWVRIRSGEDLPFPNGDIYFIKYKNSDTIVYDSAYKNYQDYWLDNYSHYCKIEKPKPPIY